MIRRIPEGFSLPPMGWTISPDFPPLFCSWCGEAVVEINTLILCPECDPIEEWPNR